MLKFKVKKKLYFPKFSLLVWAITLLAMVLATFYDAQIDINSSFAIKPSHLADEINQSWLNIFRLVSALFLHGSWQHWLGNMILFLIIALPLEKRVGGFWFLIIYFIAGFIANIVSIYQLENSNHYLLGASGAVSGLLGAWLLLFPNQNINIIIPIGLYLQKAKIPITIIALFWLSIQIILQLISQDKYPIVWVAHIVGFIIGFIIAWLYRVSNA